MKQPWDRVRLKVNYWNASHQPSEGDELHTARGRRYLIIDIIGEPVQALQCLVLPPDEPTTSGRAFGWKWGKG